MEESYVPKLAEIVKYVEDHPEWCIPEGGRVENKLIVMWDLCKSYRLIITVVPTGFTARNPDGRFQLRGSKPEILSEASDHFMSLFKQQRS